MLARPSTAKPMTSPGSSAIRPSTGITCRMVTKRPYSFLAWDLCYIFLPSPTAVKTYGNKY